MNNAFFRRQFSFVQNKLKEANRQGIFQRALAWLLLGFMLVIGLTIFVFMLLLSWLLIPLYLWRQRQFIKRSQARTTQSSEGQTIEAEVISKRED
ncbi:MAG: Integral peroxisomal membrane peroxin [Idiomarinaceae bacterium HL-53]|nr:MAG: Integral peroxisomal membrane peroxin [Idiomarinaceae bacterium HL-53]CUS49069.1 hypothetical protein Ga0003345_2056 [Idiomarinaceae bacterium HL-53]